MLKLQFKDQRKAAIWLVDSRYSIGRDTSNDIIIDADGVGGFHAELQVEEGDRIFLTDAGTAGGTRVNDKPVKARTQLRANDRIHIGEVELFLEDPKEQLQQAGDDASATAMTPALQGLEAGGGQGESETEGWLLRARTGSLVGKEYPVRGNDRLIIGRSKNCDVVLPSNHVSRQHAQIYFHGGQLWVKDLGSSNGTFVNRKKVQEGVVHGGDELRFDTLVFEVVAPEGVEEDAETTQFRAAAISDEAIRQSSAAGKTSGGAGQTASARPAARPAPEKPAPSAAGPASAAPAMAESPSAGTEGKGGGGAALWLTLVVVVAAVGAAGWWWFQAG